MLTFYIQLFCYFGLVRHSLKIVSCSILHKNLFGKENGAPENKIVRWETTSPNKDLAMSPHWD